MPNKGFKVFSPASCARLSHPETQNPCILLGLPILLGDRCDEKLCRRSIIRSDPACKWRTMCCFPTQLGLTQIALETGFLTWSKRLKLRFFVEKPGFCVSTNNKQLSINCIIVDY